MGMEHLNYACHP